MGSLADAPDLVGFFSYSVDDDEGSGGKLSKLRERIQEELRSQLGRTKRDFRLWQDKVSIQHGELWEDKIKTAIFEATFFIPIITPTAVKSRYCKFEFETFVAREKELKRNNLIFPILYIPIPALNDERWRDDPLLVIIGSRQCEQWQNLRHLDPSSTEIALRVERFCENICRALQQPWPTSKEPQEVEARRQERRHPAEAETAAPQEYSEPQNRDLPPAWVRKPQLLSLSPGMIAGIALLALLLIGGGVSWYRTGLPAGATVTQSGTQSAQSAAQQGAANAIDQEISRKFLFSPDAANAANKSRK